MPAHTTLIKKKNSQVKPSRHVSSAEVIIAVIATWVVKEVLSAALTVTRQVHKVLKLVKVLSHYRKSETAAYCVTSNIN